MKGVIYARYSEGPRQTDQSIEGQVADCTAYAEEKEIRIVGTYIDRHVSGKSVDGRDEFQRMLRDAQDGLFDCIICWKIDRFGRSREDIAVNKMRLRKAGVQLMYARESVPDGPEGILLESLLEGLAEYYSADLRQKVIRGHRESAKKGKWTTGRLPYGYKKDAEQHIIIDELAADAIREIFRKHIAGASIDELRQVLVDHGILAYDGTTPVKSVVNRILRNRHYLGEFSFQGTPIPAPAIIDEATFNEASKHFKTSRNNAAGRAKVNYLLSMKCHCGYCGKMLNGLSGRSHTGVTYHYYGCPAKGCELKKIPQETLEELVVQHTLSDVLTEEMIGKITARIMEIQETRRAEDPAEPLRKQLKENRRQQQNVANAIAVSAASALLEKLQELEDSARMLEERIDELTESRPIVPESVVRAWLESFRGGDASDSVFRKKLIKAFVADVIVDNESAVIFFNAEKERGAQGSCTTLLVDIRASYENLNVPCVIGQFIVLRVPLPVKHGPSRAMPGKAHYRKTTRP